mmetsp:Transcript_43575/g.109965  ORF Transcript_43575/g.109965 Transcript_43575/m.109965 type:complete len:221 (-) Transcript_43575:183-845(-)
MELGVKVVQLLLQAAVLHLELCETFRLQLARERRGERRHRVRDGGQRLVQREIGVLGALATPRQSVHLLLVAAQQSTEAAQLLIVRVAPEGLGALGQRLACLHTLVLELRDQCRILVEHSALTLQVEGLPPLDESNQCFTDHRLSTCGRADAGATGAGAGATGATGATGHRGFLDGDVRRTAGWRAGTIQYLQSSRHRRGETRRSGNDRRLFRWIHGNRR